MSKLYPGFVTRYEKDRKLFAKRLKLIKHQLTQRDLAICEAYAAGASQKAIGAHQSPPISSARVWQVIGHAWRLILAAEPKTELLSRRRPDAALEDERLGNYD